MTDQLTTIKVSGIIACELLRLVRRVVVILAALLGIGLSYNRGVLDGARRELQRAEEQRDELWKVIYEKQSEIIDLRQSVKRLRNVRFDPDNVI